MKGKSAFGILVGMFVLVPIIMIIAKISTGAIYEDPYVDRYDDVVQIVNDGISSTDMSNAVKVSKMVTLLCATLGEDTEYSVSIGMRQKGDRIGRTYDIRNDDTREHIYTETIWDGSRALNDMLAHICTIYNDDSWWNLDAVKTARISLMNVAINVYNAVDALGHGFTVLSDIEEMFW